MDEGLLSYIPPPALTPESDDEELDEKLAEAETDDRVGWLEDLDGRDALQERRHRAAPALRERRRTRRKRVRNQLALARSYPPQPPLRDQENRQEG
jgi:hypothetical protein